ncbi:DUF4253 domain-containing protein [Streptomyces sp. NPDC058678]|uniref:DUF4253 domain-containing protein n=1 Tax=Streptomyces sp. NPDC058678 TaxID=3346595 RepID=UPI0036625184
MATLPNPLPRIASLGLELPPGRLIDTTVDGPWHEPLLWCADGPAAPGAWTTFQHARRTIGLLPVIVDVGGPQGAPEDWELMPDEMSYPGDHDAGEVLAEFWEACAADGEEWPGPAGEPETSRAADPDTVAAEIAGTLLEPGGPYKDPRLALVPARRSADIPTAIGWTGPMNHENDTARLSSVLRDWEDRFGIRVVALGFDHLLVSVATPPTRLTDAEALAAEHFAFCPDNILQSRHPTLPGYAEHLILDQPAWHFWWD